MGCTGVCCGKPTVQSGGEGIVAWGTLMCGGVLYCGVYWGGVGYSGVGCTGVQYSGVRCTGMC